MNTNPITGSSAVQPERCVIVLNEDLPSGKAVNAAAVIALTVGQRHPVLVGAPFTDADQKEYDGLIPIGIPVLAASADILSALLASCNELALDKVIFPVEGQETNDYAEFTAAVQARKTDQLRLLGIAIIGGKKAVRKLTAQCKLFA